MPTRRLPRTDDDRSRALTTCANKVNTTPTANWLITPAQNATLQGQLSAWRNTRNAAATALSTQTTATATVNTRFTACARCISHFIQVLNLAIERGILLPGVRALYQLPVSHAAVPPINTVADAQLWQMNLENGEAARIAAGGTALAWPAIGEITASANLLTTAENSQSNAKGTYDILQENIAALRPAVDALILDLWDTIEYNLRHDAPSSLRRKAREWGVIYINDDGTEETDPPAPPVVPPIP